MRSDPNAIWTVLHQSLVDAAALAPTEAADHLRKEAARPRYYRDEEGRTPLEVYLDALTAQIFQGCSEFIEQTASRAALAE